MKILLISPLPPPMGGIATLTLRILEKLSSSIYEISCINVAHSVDKNNNKITRQNKAEPLIILIRTVISVLIKCITRQCDIIHINSSSGDGTIRDYLVERVARFFRIPIIVQYHCNLNDAVNNSRIAKKYYIKCFELSNQIIVLNRSSKEYVESKGYSSLVVPNGIPEDMVATHHLVNECIKKAVFTGRVSKRKGCLEILECAKCNPLIDFYLIGLIDESIEEQLRAVDNIRLMGFMPHEEIIKYLDEADVFIFPTYSEGFSVSLLEAMARGVPCITTNVGANMDMIENRGGLIVDAENSEVVIEAMNNLSSPKIRKEMSLWNIEKVKKYYTEKKMIESLTSIYDTVL